MATIILVDRIGANSRIERMAEEVQGTIIQMSAGYWPRASCPSIKQNTWI